MGFRRNNKYDDPELMQRVVHLKEVERKPWEEIGEKIKEEFDIEAVKYETLKDVYNRAMALTITVDKKAGKKFDSFEKELGMMYEKTIRILEKLVDALDKIYQEFEASDMNDAQKYLAFIKLSPQIKQTTDQILAYIKHHQEQQDKIRVEQKNMIYSTEQIKEKLDKYIRLLADQGKIKILKTF